MYLHIFIYIVKKIKVILYSKTFRSTSTSQLSKILFGPIGLLKIFDGTPQKQQPMYSRFFGIIARCQYFGPDSLNLLYSKRLFPYINSQYLQRFLF